MHADDKSCNFAGVKLNDAARYLFAAAFATAGMRSWLIAQAQIDLEKALKTLGYKLVPIEHKDEAA
jgi:2-keto-3-deoxy-6-phosphogluconate aldolase